VAHRAEAACVYYKNETIQAATLPSLQAAALPPSPVVVPSIPIEFTGTFITPLFQYYHYNSIIIFLLYIGYDLIVHSLPPSPVVVPSIPIGNFLIICIHTDHMYTH
jgi:hypothetical protein